MPASRAAKTGRHWLSVKSGGNEFCRGDAVLSMPRSVGRLWLIHGKWNGLWRRQPARVWRSVEHAFIESKPSTRCFGERADGGRRGTNPAAGRLHLVSQAGAIMNKLAFIAALVLAASPAAAQVATPNGQARSPTQGGTTGSTQAPITGVFCIEEMTANFCNVVTGPNPGGYGARSGSGSAGSNSSAAGGGTASIPPCPAEPPFNELCN